MRTKEQFTLLDAVMNFAMIAVSLVGLSLATLLFLAAYKIATNVACQ